MRHCRSSVVRERAEWLMLCSLCRTRCLLLCCSTRKQTFCLFWVRKPHGGRSRAGLAFLWPWSHHKSKPDLDQSASLQQGTYRLPTRALKDRMMQYLGGVASEMFPFLMHLLWHTNVYSKDTMIESQWQLVVPKCLALLPPTGCAYWLNKSALWRICYLIFCNIYFRFNNVNVKLH